MDSDASDVRELPRISDILENTLDDAPQQSQVQSLFSNEKSPGRPRGRPRKFPVGLEGNKRPVPARKRSRKTKSRSVVSDFSVDSSSRGGSSDILELSDDDDDVLESRAKQDSGSDPEYTEYSYTPGNRQRRKRRIPATYNERTIFMESMAVARAAREGISRKNERQRKQNAGPVKAPFAPPASGRMTLRQMAKKHEPERENPFLRTSGIAAIIPWPKDPSVPSPDDRVFVMKVEEQSVMQKQCGGFRRFVKSISDVVLLDLFQRVSAVYSVDGADDFVKLQQTLRFTWNSLDERVKLAWELIARRDVMVSHQKKHPEESEIVTLDDEDVQSVTDENTKPGNLGKSTETSDIVMEKAAESGTESGIPAENGTAKVEENGIPSVQPDADGNVIAGDGTASGSGSGRRSEEPAELFAKEKNLPVDLRDILSQESCATPSTALPEPMVSTSSTSPVEKDIAMTEEVPIPSPSADDKIVKRKKREITLTKEQMDELPRMPFCEQTFIAGHIERVRPDRHGLSCPLCEEGTAEELYTFREIIDHVHAMHFCAHHYGCHLCGRVFTTADQLRSHPDCVGMAEYSCQKLASLTRLLEGGNAEEAMKKINFPMQCALMYLTCADCGLCLPIRSKFDLTAVRQGLYMVFQEQWRFMIRTLSLHNCQSLVPFVIYMAEEPEEALDELKLSVVPSVCMKNMPLKCEKCEVEEFSTVEEIENHFLLPEHEETQRTCNAKYCGRTFGTEVFFQRHCLEEHLPKSLVFADYLTTQCRMFPPAGDLCSAPRLGAQGTSESFSDLKLPMGGVGKLSAGEVESFVEPFESTLYPKLLYAEEAKQNKLADSQEKKKKRKKDDDSDYEDAFDLLRELEGPQAPMDLGYEHHGRLWLQETDAESAHRSLAARIFGEHPASRDFLSGSTTRLFNNNEMMSQLGASGERDEDECAANVKVSYELEVPRSALADSWQQAMEFTVALPVNCHMSSCDVSVLNDFLLFDERVYYCHCGTICKGVISGQHAKQCFMRAKQLAACDLDMNEHISVLYSPLWPSDNRVYCRMCDESSCGISGFRYHLLSKHGMYAPFLERESPLKIPMSERALTPFYRTFSAQLADVDLGIPSNGLLNKLPEPVKEKVPPRPPTSIYAARTTTGSYAPYPGAGERRPSIAVQQARAQANRFAATSCTPSIWVPPARTVRRSGTVSQSCTLCAFDDLQGGFMIKAHFKQSHSFICTSCLAMYCNGRALFEHRTSGVCSKFIEAHCINSGTSAETVEVLCPLCSLGGHPERIVDHLRMQHFDKLRICKNSGIVRPAVTSIKLAPKSGQFAATRAIPANQGSHAVSAYTPQQTVTQKQNNDVQRSSEQQQAQAQVPTISQTNRRKIQAKATCECIICGLYCKTPLDLKKHYTMHPEQWHVCPICYVSGNTTAFVNGAVELATHLQKHHMKVYPRKHLKYCTACGLALTTPPRLIRKSGKADIFSFLQQILHHFLFVCNKLEVCMMCNTMEDSPQKHTSEDMVVHQTAKHEKNQSRFRCNQCRKYFPHRFAAEEHGCKGTMVGSYTCHCGKSFNVRLLFEDHFNAHHLTRTSQWPFVLQCSICLLQFTNQACSSHAAVHYRFDGEKVASISFEDTPLQPAMIDDIMSARMQDRYDSLAQELREEAQHAMDVQQTVTKLLVDVCENMGEPIGEEVVELSDDDDESETDGTQDKDPLVISAAKFLRTARSTLEDEWESLRKKKKKKVNGTAKPLKQEPDEEDDCVVIDATCASTSRSESVALSGSASPATLVTEDSLLHLPREENDDQTAEQTAARQSERGGQYFEEDEEGQNELGDLAVLSTQNVVSIREVVDPSADDELAVVAEVSHPAGTLPSVVASQQMQRDKIKCPRCSTMFFTKKSLTEHLRTAHRFDAGGTCTEELGIPLGTIIYVCRTCCVAFDSLPQLAGHMANHSSTDQQNCAKCSMISYSQQLKVIHDRAHLNGQLTFACHECKVCYTEEPELYGHLSEIHNVPMLYFCKSCNVASTKGSSIADHVAVNRCRIDRSNPLLSASNECRMGVLPAAMLHYNPENVETHKERLRMEVVRCVEPSVCSHRSFVASAHPMVSCVECRGLMNLQRFAAEYQSSTGQEPEFKYSNGGGSVTPPQRLALNGQTTASRLKLNPPNTRASMQNLGRAIGLPSAAAQNRAATARAHAQVRRGNQLYQAKVVLPPSDGTPPDIAPRNTVTQSTGLALVQQAEHMRQNIIGIKRKTNLQSYVRDERDRSSEEPEVLEVESTISDAGPSTSTAPPTLRPQPRAKQPAEVIDLSDDEDDDDDDIIVEESTPTVVLPKKKTIRRVNSVTNGKSTENNEIGKPCNFCSRTIPTERMLIMHSLHTNGHKYVCLDCPVTVADEQQAVEHYYREHVKRAIAKLGNSFRPLSVKVACPIRACDKTFESLSGLRIHLAQHELPHASQYCSTRFYNKETCCAHEESHREMELSGAPDANCCLLCGTLDVWQKRLPDLGQLITHTAMHGFRRFFLCRECSICFKGDAEGHKFLRHYESQHTTADGETAGHLLCTVCDERFPKEEMSNHAREKHFVTGFKRHTDAVEGQLIVKTGSQMRIMLGMEKIYGEGDGSDID